MLQLIPECPRCTGEMCGSLGHDYAAATADAGTDETEVAQFGGKLLTIASQLVRRTARPSRIPMVGNATASQLPLSIVVVSLGNVEQLLECLQFLRESNILESSPGADCEVVAVDLSGDNSAAESVEAQFPCVTLVAQEPTAGFATACNAGIERSRGRRVLLLDAHTRIPGRLLPDLLIHMDANECAAAVGPQLLQTEGTPVAPPTISAGNQADPTGSRPDESDAGMIIGPSSVEWLPATCLLLRRSALDAVGLFCEGILLYSEELEWCRRARENDWEIHHVPSVEVQLTGVNDRTPSTENTVPAGAFSLSRLLHFHRRHAKAGTTPANDHETSSSPTTRVESRS